MGLDTQFVPEANERGREATMVDPTVTCLTHNHTCPHSLRGEKSCFFHLCRIIYPSSRVYFDTSSARNYGILELKKPLMASEPRGSSLLMVISTSTFSFNDPPYVIPSGATSCVQLYSWNRCFPNGKHPFGPLTNF